MGILVTGATGFVGSSLVERLVKENFSVSAAVRNASKIKLKKDINLIHINDLSSSLDWGDAMRGVDVVIHLAARAHILKDEVRDPLVQYRYINVDCSLNLASQAARAGVKRFIYVSSIKVNGESTILGRPFTANDIPMPQDFYGISKHEAELGLQRIADGTEMELVIIRPPLVYGPGVKGNILNLMRWIMRSLPLPLGAVRNRRSLVSLDNLVDFIITCIDHPCAANQTFLVSDGEDLSTVDLCTLIGRALNKPVRLISVPVSLIYFFTAMVKRRAMADRLCLSLQVDISSAKNLLGWSPKVGVAEALIETTRDFLKKNSKV